MALTLLKVACYWTLSLTRPSCHSNMFLHRAFARCRISCVVLCSHLYHSTCYSCIYCIYYQKPTAQLQVPWFPRRIQDLERACKTVFNYGEEFTPDHPVSSVQVKSTYIKLPCLQERKFYLCTLDRLLLHVCT